MRKNRILLLIALLLALAVTVLVFRKKIFHTSHLMDFAVTDTASITRIFIADKSGHQCTLDKVSPGRWRVNNKYNVQHSKMDNLMDAIYRVRVKSPVPQKERDDVVRILNTSVKVMIYKGDELLKVYYVGSETSDYLGTYMCIENADDPMICEIPGFNGYLTPRFITLEEDWKSNTFVECPEGSIEELQVLYSAHPEASFAIRKGNAGYEVKGFGKEANTTYTNPQKIKEYLNLFANLAMEGYDNRATNAIGDSLQSAEPFATLTIKKTDGTQQWVKVFYKILPPGHERPDESGKLSNIDANRYYALTNTDKRIMVVQVFNFGRVLQRIEFFK